MVRGRVVGELHKLGFKPLDHAISKITLCVCVCVCVCVHLDSIITDEPEYNYFRCLKMHFKFYFLSQFSRVENVSYEFEVNIK